MIDTIILDIPGQYCSFQQGTIQNPWILQNNSNGFAKHVKNETSIQRKDAVYRPRLAWEQRGYTSVLKIEFSAPKLLFNNNVDELVNTDFPIIINTLQQRLKEYGVTIEKNHLINAKVRSFHPSKNIEIKSGYTTQAIIRELHKTNVTKRMDLNKDSFRNEGQSLQLYTNSHSLIVYDKIADLNKPKKRAADKDQTVFQKNLFNDIGSTIELLRIEIRLCKKQAMNRITKEVAGPQNPTFKDIFNQELCKKIILHQWNKLVVENSLFLFSLKSKPETVLATIFEKWPTITPKEAIYRAGLHTLCQEAGIRNVRNIIEQHSTTRSWYRTTEVIKALSTLHSPTDYHKWIQECENAIKSMKPYKLPPTIKPQSNYYQS